MGSILRTDNDKRQGSLLLTWFNFNPRLDGWGIASILNIGMELLVQCGIKEKYARNIYTMRSPVGFSSPMTSDAELIYILCR